MPIEKGVVLSIERVKVDRKSKGLLDAYRTDLILLADQHNKPCRFQVRKDKQPLLVGIKPKDRVTITFRIEMNEIEREGNLRRFDNNILQDIKKTIK